MDGYLRKDFAGGAFDGAHDQAERGGKYMQENPVRNVCIFGALWRR